MGNTKYSTIQIPKELANLIDEIIEHRNLGYRSRAEFVVEAIRRKIEETPKNQEVAATV